MKKIFTSFAILFVLIQGVFAQNINTTISGTVINSNTGLPLANQAVYIATDSMNMLFNYFATVYTDQNGFYIDSLGVPSNSQTVFYISTSDCNGAMLTQTVVFYNLPMVANFSLQCNNQVCAAYFYPAADSINPGMSYTFYDQSATGGGNITSWYWDFGDGTNSSVQTPNHVYAVPGYYIACLTIATDLGCSSTICDSILADTTQPVSCQAYFSYQNVGNTISFYGWSSDVNSTYLWNFGDNTSSILQNPVHTFTNGTFTVCLTITTSNGCTSTTCSTFAFGNPITGCPATFTTYRDSTNYLLYYFYATNGVPSYETCSWTFGDGTASTLIQPSHTYTTLGAYTVCLTIYDSLSNILCSYCDSILVDTSNTQACQASFGYQITNAFINEVSYYGYSSDINSTYYWNFGDNTTSTLQNPVHVFANGNYTVCLTITTSNGCTNTTCGYIGFGNPTNCSAQFYLYPDSMTLHHYYAVNMAYGTPPFTCVWSWGDGTSDTAAYPSHTYSSAGVYTICLTVADATGCSSTYCDSTYIQKSANSIIYVDVIPQGTTGIIENYKNADLTLYPNPATDNLIIQTSGHGVIEVLNVEGQLIESISVNYNKTTIDVSTLPDGVYFVKMKTDTGMAVKKFVKE